MLSVFIRTQQTKPLFLIQLNRRNFTSLYAHTTHERFVHNARIATLFAVQRSMQRIQEP